jgi:mRNA interferase HigB
MRVISSGRIREYGEKHPDAKEALLAFLKVAEKASWDSIIDLRRTYPHADAVSVASGKVVTVLNVRGNTYRLIVAMHYNTGRVYILRFLTHAEYDKEAWKDTL